MIDAAQMTSRIIIQKKQYTKNAIGENILTWQDVATVWAHIKDLSGREINVAIAVQSESTKRITIRYINGITSDMRVKHGLSIMAITAPPRAVGERKSLLEIDVSEGIVDG